jgi:alpha-beta hydrolase superfamily lysophospholipase
MQVSSPLLILHGDVDQVTDPSINKTLYESSINIEKTLNLYEGGYHCILEGEPDERIFQALDDITSWLDVHCGKREG